MGNMNCLLRTSLALAGISCFAGDLSVEGNLNVTSNLSSRSLSATGAAVGSLAVDGATVLNGTLTIAGQRVQAGANASATNGNTFVWSDGTVFGSTASNQFSAFASGGFRFLGGQIQGDGAGLSNLTATVALGASSVTTDKLAADSVIAEKLADGSVTSAKIADGSIVDADVSAGAAISQAKVSGLPAAVGLLNTHTASAANPHQVTAAQVGAYTTNQTDAAITSALSGFNPGSCVQTNHTGDVTVGGTLAALMFMGNGAGLTNLTFAGIAPGSVGAEALAPGAVGAASIAIGSVGTNKAAIAEWNSWGDSRYMNQPGNQQGVLLADGSVPLAGNLQMAGTNRVTGLADAIDGADAVNRQTMQAAIQQALLDVGPLGNLSMGTFTAH